ncbi:MAG: ABC transporter substrate-binding protein [Oscillospiraceae bacterium]
MKTLKSILAASLALTCVVSATACQSGTPQSNVNSAPSSASLTTKATMNSEDAAAVAEIDIGAEKLENGTVKFLSSWDINPTEGNPVPVSLEMFQTQYGGTIELVSTTWDERYTKLATLIQADDAPDMFSAADMDIFPKGAMNGMFQPLDDYVDFESELWAPMAAVNEQFAFKGKHYVGAFNTDSQCLMFYNKNTIIENGLPDPVELLENDNWNWDTFWDMMMQFCNEEESKYATDGWWFEGAFSLTTGVPYIGMRDGEIVHNLDDGTIDKAQEFMLNMNKYSLPFPKSKNNWQIMPSNIGAGKTLFYPVGTYALYPYNNIIQSFGDMEDVMFVPMPKCPYTDEYYLPSIVEGFALCVGAKNPEGVGAYLNCCMASRDSEIAKEIGKKQAFEEHGWTQEQYDMLEKVRDMTNEHPVIEMYTAVNDMVEGYINNPMKEGYNNGVSWTQTKETIRSAVQAQLDEANLKLEGN